MFLHHHGSFRVRGGGHISIWLLLLPVVTGLAIREPFGAFGFVLGIKGLKPCFLPGESFADPFLLRRPFALILGTGMLRPLAVSEGGAFCPILLLILLGLPRVAAGARAELDVILLKPKLEEIVEVFILLYGFHQLLMLQDSVPLLFPEVGLLGLPQFSCGFDEWVLIFRVAWLWRLLGVRGD